MKKLTLNILDLEKSTFFNRVITGSVEVIGTPEMALSILNNTCEFYELTNQRQDINIKRPYVEVSRDVNDLPSFTEWKALLLENSYTVSKGSNKNFKTAYAVFEDGTKYQLECEVVGRIPKRDSDSFGSSRHYQDGNIWGGESKND